MCLGGASSETPQSHLPDPQAVERGDKVDRKKITNQANVGLGLADRASLWSSSSLASACFLAHQRLVFSSQYHGFYRHPSLSPISCHQGCHVSVSSKDLSHEGNVAFLGEQTVKMLFSMKPRDRNGESDGLMIYVLGMK